LVLTATVDACTTAQTVEAITAVLRRGARWVLCSNDYEQ